MTKAEAKEVLRKAFLTLELEERASLRWHAQNGTQIYCGEPAVGKNYVSPDSAG